MRGLCVLFMIVFVGSVMSMAQEKRLVSREVLDALVFPDVMPDGNKVLSFDAVEQDFGVIYENSAPFVVDFLFVNVSDKPVRITRVTSNCGCTATEIGDSLIAPGKKGIIAITFNPRGRSGTVDTNTFVYTSLSEKKPVAKLTLLGNVIDNDEWKHLPHRMGALKLKRKEVTFEPVKAGSMPQQRIPCANVGVVPLSLSSKLLPGFVIFSTVPREIAPGEEGDIVITINSDILPADAPRLFNVVVDGVKGRITDRTIKVNLEK